jgi:ATP-dependent DNA helicase RecG
MIIEYLRKFREADRKTIDDLLLDKVSDALNETQKRQYIKDLLQEMRKAGTIRTVGSRSFGARWELTHPLKKGTR